MITLRQAPPLDLSFWSFLTFLHHGFEEVERHKIRFAKTTNAPRFTQVQQMINFALHSDCLLSVCLFVGLTCLRVPTYYTWCLQVEGNFEGCACSARGGGVAIDWKDFKRRWLSSEWNK